MSNAAKLAKLAFTKKPNGVAYSNFTLTDSELKLISDQLPKAIIDTAYAAIISYAEAMAGIPQGSSSWSIIRLYYSAFYCLKTMMLMKEIIPFNCKNEMLFDLKNNKFYKGGNSSHHWNWNSLRTTPFKQHWFSSQDSQDAYEALRSFREDANYTHAFTDPNLPKCLVNENWVLARRFRNYRDDTGFLYTYLPDHLAIAYPTKLIFEVDSKINDLSYELEPERARHVRTVWKIQDRCPIAC